MKIQTGNIQTFEPFCDRCSLSHLKSTFEIPDWGNLNAEVMLLGEAPGANEVVSQRPFIGAAGHLLNDILRATGWDRQAFYIANTVHCQPPERNGSHKPTQFEIDCCKWRLYHAIASIQPKLIIAMGNVAINALFNHEGITDFRGQALFWEPNQDILNVFPTISKKIKVLPTFHPSYLLRNWEEIKYGLVDFNKAYYELEHHDELIGEPEITYYVCSTMDHVEYLISQLEVQDDIVFDCETSALSWEEGEVLCWSFCWKDMEAWVLPFNSIHQELWTDSERNEILDKLLTRVFENSNVKKTSQNIIFDWQFLLNYKINIVGDYDDTMQMAHLVDENLRKDLDTLAELYTEFKRYSEKLAKAYLPNKNSSYALIPDANLWYYAAKDSIVTRAVKKVLEPKLEEQKLTHVYKTLVLPLIDLIVDSTRYGAYVSRERVEQLANELKIEVVKLEQEIYKIVGYEFNTKSPKQLQKVLFETLKLQKGRKVKTGYSTDINVLEKLAKTHRVPEIMLTVREINKQIGTYLTGSDDPKKETGMARYIDADNRIHTEFLPHGAKTGRISSRNPNLENIPRESIIRSLFTAPPGSKLIIADYGQAELWDLAFASKDKNLLFDLRTGDVHDATARKVVCPNIHSDQEVPDDARIRAKGVNFGVSYGRGAWSLVENLGISMQEATKLLKDWFNRYYNVYSWIKMQHENAKSKGYVKTITGRRRHLYGLKYLSSERENSRIMEEIERQAQNSPIQGGAGEYMLEAAVECKRDLYPIFPNHIIKITNLVHDCIIIECPEEIAWKVYFIVIDIMERERYGLRIPVDCYICDYWSQEKDKEFKKQFKELLAIECTKRELPFKKDYMQFGWRMTT